MSFIRRSLPLASLVSLSLSPLIAAEPVIEVAIPDMEQTRQRFLASPYGRVLMTEQAATLRQRIREFGAQAAAEMGFDPLVLILDSDGAELALGVHERRDEPRVQMQLRGAAVAAALAPLLENAMPQMAAGSIVEREGFAVDGDHLLIATQGAGLDRQAIDDSAHDLRITWHRDAIMTAVASRAGDNDAAKVQLIEDLLPEGSLTADFSSDGMHQSLHLKTAPAGLQAVDQSLLATLPTDCLGVYAMGLKGSEWWQAHGAQVLRVVAQEMRGPDADIVAVEEQLAGMLSGFGIQGGLAGIAAMLEGTALLVVGSGGSLIPSLSIALPRQQGLDNLVGLGLGMAGMHAPNDGQMRFLVLRGMGDRGEDIAPGVVIGRSTSHWWISTDPVFLAEYLDGETGGWNNSEIGTRALSRAGDQAAIIGATNAKALLRTIVPLATLGAGFLDEGRHIQTIGMAALQLAREAQADTMVGQPQSDGTWKLDVQGTVGGLSYASSGQLALIAAIAIPNLLESKITANESVAASTLRSGIFTAQETFRASGHNDLDNDNKGEYGFLPHLAGTMDTLGNPSVGFALEAGQLELLGAEFGEPLADINGYHFQMWLSDGEGGALTVNDYTKRAKAGELNAAAINSAEIYYVCYAWPAEPGDSGRRVFAITNGGRVLVSPETAMEMELPPKWDALKPGATQFRDFRNPDWDPM